MKKVIKKAQTGTKTSKLPPAKKKGAMDAIRDLGKYISTGGLATERYNPAPKKKMGGAVKAKKGGSFPDLNKDGKITKADILKGRGVIAKKGKSVPKGMHKMPDGSLMKNSEMKKGGKLKKQAAVAIAMKKAGKTPKTMKSGGKMKKCEYGCK